MLLAVIILAAPPPSALTVRAAELEARARAHHEAREHAEAANIYLALSSLPGVDVDDALGRAHLDLEAAFTATQDTMHLCRALRLARGRLARAKTGDEQKRLFWEETVAEDLEQLASVGGEASCPTMATGPVHLLAAEDTPPASTGTAPQLAGAPSVDDGARRSERRLQARRAAGMTLMGVGVGLAGLMGAALGAYRAGYKAIEAAGDKRDEFAYSPGQEAALRRQHADTELARGLAIGLGVASAATLATGIGLLSSHRRALRRVALLPSGAPRGGGLTFRLRF